MNTHLKTLLTLSALSLLAPVAAMADDAHHKPAAATTFTLPTMPAE